MVSILFITIIFSIVMLLISLKIYSRWTCARCDSKVCLVGKTAVVTGGSSGIGFQLALNLASRGCKVIIADKNVCTDIKDNIIRESQNPNIYLEYVDLASFASVRKLAERLKKSEEKLDILINNAGIGKNAVHLTEDGLNSVWQINYFGPFLLTHLLVDLLKNSPSGRIIFTSSCTAYIHNLFPNDVKGGKIKQKMEILDYPNSKFMMIAAANIFAKKLKKFKITSNSWHPGCVHTPIFQKTTENTDQLLVILVVYFMKFLVLFMGKTPEEGAQTALHLAISKEVENVTGEFFGEAAPTFQPRGSGNKQLCEGIWNASEVIVELRPEEKL